MRTKCKIELLELKVKNLQSEMEVSLQLASMLSTTIEDLAKLVVKIAEKVEGRI